MSGLPHPPRDDDVREIGMVEDVNGNPVYFAVYRGQVNIAGFHFDKQKYGEFMQMAASAGWEAGEGHG